MLEKQKVASSPREEFLERRGSWGGKNARANGGGRKRKKLIPGSKFYPKTAKRGGKEPEGRGI